MRADLHHERFESLSCPSALLLPSSDAGVIPVRPLSHSPSKICKTLLSSKSLSIYTQHRGPRIDDSRGEGQHESMWVLSTRAMPSRGTCCVTAITSGQSLKNPPGVCIKKQMVHYLYCGTLRSEIGLHHSAEIPASLLKCNNNSSSVLRQPPHSRKNINDALWGAVTDHDVKMMMVPLRRFFDNLFNEW